MQALFLGLWIIGISFLVLINIKFEKYIRFWISKNKELILLILGSIIMFVIRIALFHRPSGDMTYYLEPWAKYIKNLGFFTAFKDPFYDYAPLYLYGIAFTTILPVPTLISVKLLSVSFDFIGAFFVYKIAKEFFYKNSYFPVIAYLIFLFIPTVMVNSAYFGQCDVIFTTFIIISIYYFLKNKMLSSVFFYSIALSLKLQAIFVFPFLILLWLKKQVKTWHFLLIPGVYFLTILPAAFAGRPLIDLLMIYFKQTKSSHALTLFAPNIYQWFDNFDFNLFNRLGILFTAFVVLMLLLFMWRNNRLEKDKRYIIEIVYLFSVIVPFLLPQMHERYFFIADAVGLLYMMYKPKNFYLPLIVWFASIFSYIPPLWNYVGIPSKILSAGNLIVVIKLLYDTFNPSISNNLLYLERNYRYTNFAGQFLNKIFQGNKSGNRSFNSLKRYFNRKQKIRFSAHKQFLLQNREKK